MDELGECAEAAGARRARHGPTWPNLRRPGFLFAAGRLDVARRFTLPQAVWDGLVPATYYVRFVSRPDWKILRTFALTKTGPSLATDAERASADLVHA